MKGTPSALLNFPSSRVMIVLAVLVLTLALAAMSTVATVIAAPGEQATADDKNSEADEAALKRKPLMESMRRIATGLAVTVTDDGQHELDVLPEALFRTHDQAREEFDGTIWGYGKTGRPTALLTLTLVPNGEGMYKWLYELNSLATRPVSAKIPGYGTIWSTRKGGLEMKEISQAPAAAENETGRTRQFRELSSRFTGSEMTVKTASGRLERFELRLIPRPIHRYSDLQQGLVDGAIFLMAHSTNPEIIMVIELVREAEKSVWKAGFSRCAFAEVHVELDGKDVWSQPHINQTSSGETYSMFVRPVQPGELEGK